MTKSFIYLFAKTFCEHKFTNSFPVQGNPQITKYFKQEKTRKKIKSWIFSAKNKEVWINSKKQLYGNESNKN